MGDNYIIERKIDPMNILIVFLIGLAATLFLVGSIETFGVVGDLQMVLIISTCVLYVIALVAFLWPKKTETMLPADRVVETIRTVEKPVFRMIEKPIYRTVEKIVEKEVEREVEKVVAKNDDSTKKKTTPIIVVHAETKKEKPKPKSKYVGSSYNERYHLRTCRFAGAIKIQYLVEENDRKYFELRGYTPCKVCHPDKK